MPYTVDLQRSQSEARIGPNWQREYTRKYRVKDASMAEIDEYDALAAALDYLGGIGATHPRDAGSFLRTVSAEPESKDQRSWIATAQWGGWTDSSEDPILAEEKVTWEQETRESVADVDANGNAIVNSAGDYFDPPITRDDSRPILTITRNEAGFSDDLADYYRDTVNDATFFGKAAGTIKCMSITSEMERGPTGESYWRVTYRFAFNRDGWNARPLDQGYRYISGGERKPILIDGEPASSPVPLNGSGGVLSVGDDPVFLDFARYPSRDYSAFAFASA